MSPVLSTSTSSSPVLTTVTDTSIKSAATAGSRRIQTLVIADLRAQFEQLAEANPRPAAYLHAVARAIVSHNRHLGYSISGRIAAETLEDSHCHGTLSADQQLHLRQLLSRAVLSGHGEVSARISGPYALAEKRTFLIALPMLSQSRDDLVASVCFALCPASDQEVQLRAYELQACLLLAQQLIPVARKSLEKPAFDETLQVTARVSRYGDTREFGFALVNSIASRFDCEQVALGLASGNQTNIFAISGTDTFKLNSPGVIDIQQVMEECRDAEQTLVFQLEGQTSKQKAMPIHTRWGTSCQTDVCSIPLMAGAVCVAVLTLRRHRRLGFSDANVEEIEKLTKPFGAAIELSLRGDRTLTTHFHEASRRALAAIRQPKTRSGRITRNLAMAVAVILIFGWLPYQPMTPCVLVPGNLIRTLAAFDMQLSQVTVRSGDRVARGQVLAKFETRQLELERAGLVSQFEQAEVDVRKALVKSDAAVASLAKANSQVFAAQLAAVDKKINQCTIVAPADGMVMEAELHRKLGQVFPLGSPILSFAPLDSWQLEIHVPEHQARHFHQQQTGSFAPAANPGRKLNYTIASISGSAELIDGKNVFVATAQVEGDAEYFRQGMAGVARTYTGWQPIPWILLHRLIDYGRAGFWM